MRPVPRALAAVVAAIVDLLVVAAAYLLATGVRLGGRLDSPEHTGAAAVALAAGAAQVAANLGFRVYRRDWAVAALEDVSALSAASAVVAAGLVAINLVSPEHFIPNGAVLPGLGLALVAQAALKLRPRWREIARAAFGRRSGEGAIIVGSGRVGQLLARDLADGQRGTRVVCFIDDDPARQGAYVRGIRVEGGVDDLPALLRRHRPVVVVIADRERDPTFVRQVLDRCRDTGVRVRAVSGFGLARSDRSPLRRIEIEELLHRERVTLDDPRARSFLHGKTVLVTGGAGSIGRVLAARVLELAPARLALVDISESGLHDALQDLGGRPEVETELADVRDRGATARLIRRLGPDVVFHAAAYKHVPVVERHPAQGIATNVLGTASVLEAARAARVSSVVFISSDKAARPASILGLTKRFGELLTLAHARADERPHAVVRFGNVLGTAGSVVPLFARQIDAGGPVTITHPDATRYFMTPDEAAGLVIHAAAMAEPGGDLLVLDMGEPVRIVDLARTMAWLHGLSSPEHVEMRVIGLRPGEKLHEELFFAHETAVPTDHARVLRIEKVGSAVPSLDRLERGLAAIEDRLAADDIPAAIAALERAVETSDPVSTVPGASAAR